MSEHDSHDKFRSEKESDSDSGRKGLCDLKGMRLFMNKSSDEKK